MQHNEVRYSLQLIAHSTLPRCAVKCFLQCSVFAVWIWLGEYTGGGQAMPSCVIVPSNHQTHSFSSAFQFSSFTFQSSVSPFQQLPWRQPLRCWFQALPACLPTPSRPSLPPPSSPPPPPSRPPPPSHLPLLPQQAPRLTLVLLPKQEILVLLRVLICLVWEGRWSAGLCCLPWLRLRRELRRCCTPEYCIDIR